MPRLIHLNGLPGSGKSTAARVLGAARPGALVLDADTVVAMLAGYERDFFGFLAPARTLGAAMASAHLAAGHDVILPQLVTAPAELDPYHRAAEQAGAEVVELVLVVSPATAARRFATRGESRSGVDAVIARVIREGGGAAFLNKIGADLERHLHARPDVRRIDVDGLAPDATAREVERILRLPAP